MMRNRLGQPVGRAIKWTPPPAPQPVTLRGRTCLLEPLQRRHAAGLFRSNRDDAEGRMWTYLSYGPFECLEAYESWLDAFEGANDPLFFAVTDTALSQAVGVASYLRIAPTYGTIEIGHIAFSPLLQQTTAATEALFLLMNRAFDLGYRRLEWKCDALNAASRRAAQRLGFRFEGIFRQATVYKGRNRDTAWYAVLDNEWPTLKAVFEAWLLETNFGADGRQQTSLTDLTARARTELEARSPDPSAI